MNVLFALGSSTEQTAKNIADRYYEKYGEILTYTNKYFFKALLDEIKVNKTYDRIVINEDFEETRTRDIELFDRMIFNYIDQITDEIEDADIILICTDRRRKGDAFVNEVFRRGIYNLLMGDDRNINPLCEIIRKPKTKKEAKVYLNINPMHVGETALMRDDDVDEAQILNIIAYYENIKNKPEEFVPTFNRIKEQYSRPQLKTILNSLPNNVRNVILAADEFKYLGISETATKVTTQPLKRQVQEQPAKILKSGWSLFGGKKKNKIDEKRSSGTIEIENVMSNNEQVDLNKHEDKHKENLIFRGREKSKNFELDHKENEQNKDDELKKQAELEERARKEAEAREQAELAEKARREVEARQQAALEEKARKEAEAREQAELAEKARREVEARQQAALEEKARKEAEARQQVALEEKARKESEAREQAELAEKARREAEAREQAELAEKARREVEARQQAALEEKARKEAEARQQAELEERARKEAEARQQAALEEKARKEAEARQQAELEERAKKEIESNRKVEEIRKEQEDFKRKQQELMEQERVASEARAKFNLDTNQVQSTKKIGEDGLLFSVKPNPNAPDRKTENIKFVNTIEEINKIPLVQPKANDFSQNVEIEINNKLNADIENNQIENPPLEVKKTEPLTENKKVSNIKENLESNDAGLNVNDDKLNNRTGEVIRPMNNEISEQERKIREEHEKLEAERRKIREEQERIESERRKIREEQEKLENARNKLKNSPMGYEDQSKMYSNNMQIPQMVTLNLKKMIVFVGANKAGTTFVTNAVAHAVASNKITTAILDMTRDKSMFYLYNQNDKSLRKKAEECMQRMSEGEDYYLDTTNSYLKVYTTTPGSISDVRRSFKHKSIIDVATANANLVIVDADFTTPIDYFEQASEIYLVQDLDLLKMPDATLFLRELKNRGMDMKKIRIIINKYIKTSLTPKQIIQSLSYYSDPSMSFVDDLLPSKVDYWMIPYNLNNYAKYIDSVCHGIINYKGYSTDFTDAINEITSVIYPKITGGNGGGGKPKRFFG